MVAVVSWAVRVYEEMSLYGFINRSLEVKIKKMLLCYFLEGPEQSKGWCLGREISVLFLSHRSTIGSIPCDF